MLLHIVSFRRRMVVSEMTRKPFCHLNLTFDLINLVVLSIMENT